MSGTEKTAATLLDDLAALDPAAGGGHGAAEGG